MGNTRTWSEIKLRNPSAEVCAELSRILDHFDEATAPKAVERLILSYMDDWERERMLDRRINELKDEIAGLESQLAQKDSEMAAIRELYTRFHNLMTGTAGYSIPMGMAANG